MLTQQMFHTSVKQMAYFGMIEGQQACLASVEEDLQSTVCQKIPLFMELTDVFIR